MKKVIESGKKEFIAVCDKCGCKFSYELEDVAGGVVNCPECDEYVVHLRQATTAYGHSMTVEDFNRLYPNLTSSQTHHCATCKYMTYTTSNSTAAEPVAWCTLPTQQKEISGFSLGCMFYIGINE